MKRLLQLLNLSRRKFWMKTISHDFSFAKAKTQVE